MIEKIISTINNPRADAIYKEDEHWYDDIIKIFIRPVWFILTVVGIERSIYYLSQGLK